MTGTHRHSDTIYAPATAPGRAAIAIIRLSGPAGRAGAAGARRQRCRRRAWRGMSGCAIRLAARRSTTGWRCGFRGRAAPPARMSPNCICTAAAPCSPRSWRRCGGLGPAPRRARRIHPPRFSERQARPDPGRGGRRSRRRRDRSAAPPGLAPARRRARRTLYRGWSERLLRLLAHLEAAIDFPDEDLPPEIEARVAADTASLADEIAAPSGRRASRRAAARRHRGRDRRAAECRQIEPVEPARAARGGDHLADRRHDARRDRGRDRPRRLSGRARRHRRPARQRRSDRAGGAAPRAGARRGGRIAALRVRRLAAAGRRAARPLGRVPTRSWSPTRSICCRSASPSPALRE